MKIVPALLVPPIGVAYVDLRSTAAPANSAYSGDHEFTRIGLFLR
ncbi:MAG: hypothetical protein OXU68_06930 [Bacteroidota bacterium]|nr:hypothetical protein [Bacteroidota bacterium]MDE2956718.1 hypothetical protein [Bacteroidota bacterium]